MPFLHYVYTVPTGAAPASLASVLADPSVGGRDDIPCRQITLQLISGTKAFVGGNQRTVSATDHAVALAPNEPPVVLGGFDAGPIKLSDLYATGTAADKIAIGLIPY